MLPIPYWSHCDEDPACEESRGEANTGPEADSSHPSQRQAVLASASVQALLASSLTPVFYELFWGCNDHAAFAMGEQLPVVNPRPAREPL